jgi:hypothetical protein
MGQEALDRSETIPERNDRQCTAPRSVEYEFEDEHEIAHRTVFRNCERVCSSSSKERMSFLRLRWEKKVLLRRTAEFLKIFAIDRDRGLQHPTDLWPPTY